MCIRKFHRCGAGDPEIYRSGKSVIFAHDTTSYINTDHQKIYGQIARDGYNSNGTVNSGGSIVFMTTAGCGILQEMKTGDCR